MSLLEGSTNSDKDGVVSLSGGKLIRARRNVQNTSVIVDVDEEGERTSLTNFIVHKVGIRGEVVKAQTSSTIGQHSTKKVDNR